jgi:hypothetical protein
MLVDTQAFQMKAGEGSIMAVPRAVTVTRKHYRPPPVLHVMTATTPMSTATRMMEIDL